MIDEPVLILSSGQSKADRYRFCNTGKLLLRICYDHKDMHNPEECPYCRIAELEEVIDGIQHVYLTASDEIDRDIGVSRILDAYRLKEQGE